MARLTRSLAAIAAASLTLLAGCTAGTPRVQQASPSGPGSSSRGSTPSTAASGTTTSHPPLSDHGTSAEVRAARSRPVEDPYYPDTSNPEFDALHYRLRIDWDGTTLRGDTTVTFRAATATRRVRLDLSQALTASKVVLDGRPIGHTQTGNGLEMRTGPLERNSTHVLEIVYSGRPHSTPAPSQRSDMAEGLGWSVDSHGSVYTFQEPYGAFTWYPVNDHPSDKALYDADITTHGRDVAVFNGELVSRSRHRDATTSRWHLDAPAASYLVTLAIGPYTRSTVVTPDGMPISYWVQPRDRNVLRKLQTEGSSAFDWLTAHAGPYPFSSLGVVVVDGDSAMETQTMITYGRDELGRRDSVLAHEMAHQWFGDSLTPRTWQDLWLNEGWAMYMEQWYETDTGGFPYAGGLRRWRRIDQLSRNHSGPPGDYRPDTFADANVYLGPAMMLDCIRQRIGDRAFDALVKAWPAQHRYDTVDRAMFSRWLRSDTGLDLRPLLHRWLDSARTPRLPG